MTGRARVAILLGLGSLLVGSSLTARAETRYEAAPWLDQEDLSATGFGTVALRTHDGQRIEARIYRAHGFDPAHGPIWFVMHGASRDADRYIRAAAPVAERYGALAVVLEFSRRVYPKGKDYTLGVKRTGWFGIPWLGGGRWREPSHYVYAEVERSFEAIKRSLDGQQKGYFLFGHSAGAQFTHRLLTFLPDARVLGAVAANAGWYTLPADHDDRLQAMPYGLKGSPTTPAELRDFFAMPFVVLLGERDTTTAASDRLVRGTPEAQAQGNTRLERGRHYFSAGQTQARSLGTDFRWRLAVVPRAKHDAAQMIDSAGYYLFESDSTPCTSTAASAATRVVFRELLADPAKGTSGDANQDGERDPEGDEFVEIVNVGHEAVCLGGWSLGDAKKNERHVFPLGRALEPGETLVVFGGGVPTGRFGDAIVQCASRGLSLTNAGDVLTLRDAQDEIVAQFSWGDADGKPRAADHWPDDLGDGASLTRTEASDNGPGDWMLHPEWNGRHFSPGYAVEQPRVQR